MNNPPMIRLLCKRKWLESAKILVNSPTHSSSLVPLRRLKCLSDVPSLDHRSFSSDISRHVSSSNSVPELKLERINSSGKPEKVRQFFLDFNFSEIQLESIVSRWPRVLVADPEKTLMPKFNFFLSKGLTEADVIKIVFMEPKLLSRSVQKYMIPLFDFLRNVVGSKENVTRVVKTYPSIFRSSVAKALESNLATLRESGVPGTEISKLLLSRPKAIMPVPSRFLDAIAKAKELGFDPSGPRFGSAITVLGWCSKTAWEGKLQTFRCYGLSNDEIYMGFRLQPLFMMLKEQNIRAKMDFFVKSLNWSPSKLMIAPSVLLCSLEERSIRRLSILYLLASTGSVKEFASVQWIFSMPESLFVKRYVTPFQDEVPRVLEANQGKWKVHDWSSFDINTVFKRNVYVADYSMKPFKGKKKPPKGSSVLS